MVKLHIANVNIIIKRKKKQLLTSTRAFFAKADER